MKASKLGRLAVAATVVSSLLCGFGTPVSAATKTQVTIWSYGNVIEPWAEKQYETLHPNIDLKIKKNSMDAHHQSLITAFRANTTPDIAAIEVSYSGFFRSYPKYFQDLSNIGLNENDYLDWRWNQGVATGGKVIGIPTDVGGLQVAYRIDLFKAHGLPYKRDEVSALWPTWSDFIATGKKYVSKLSTKEKSSCKTKKVCYGFIDNAGTMFPAILNQGAKKYYETNGTLIYETNPQVKTAFTTTATALNSGISTRINQFTSDWNAGMNKGIFAAVLAPAWMLDYIKQQASATKGKWDIADLPGGGGNLGGSQLSVPAAAKHSAEAKAFIAWYLSPAIQLEIFKRYGLFPSAKSLYNNSSLTGYKDKFFNNAPVGQIYVDGAKKLKPIYEGKNQRAIDNYFGQSLSKVALGKLTASNAWADAISNIKKNVKN